MTDAERAIGANRSPASRGQTVAGNIGALLGSHLIGLAASLLTVPYLARVLRPDGWGPVLMAQALAGGLLTLLDYAFDLSLARRVAAARRLGPDAHGQVARLMADATAARLVLAALALVAWAGALFALPPLRHNGLLAAATLVYALARGFTPLWYFLGVERLRTPIAIDTATRVGAALAVFLLVHTPAHGWRVLAAQAVMALVSLLLLMRRLRRELPQAPLTRAGALETLRDGFPLFAARASGALYMQGTTLLMGLVAAPATVALFGGSERIVRAAIGLLEPVSRALVPRLSYLQGANPEAAQQLVRRLMVQLGAASALAAAAAAAVAPWVIRFLLGPGYEAAVPVFRLMLLLLPIITLATTIGIYWAVPRGHDRMVLAGTLAAGTVNLLLAVPLTRRLQANGTALSVVIAEGVVAVVLLGWYLRSMTAVADRSMPRAGRS